MKLLNRAILYYSITMFLSFIYTGALLYSSIRHVVLRQVTESLLTEKQIIQDELAHTDTIPDFSDIFNHEIQVNLYKGMVTKSQHFADSMVYDSATRQMAEFRFLVYKNNTADNRGYMIITSRSIDQEKQLLFEILGIIILLFAVLLLLLIIIISSISRRLWGTFYTTLNNIRTYDVKSNRVFFPVSTHIAEFKELNQVLESLTDKIASEYRNLKEFSENASHEIQTPLAVIRLRLDQILQSSDISGEMAEHLVSIGQSVSKISKINQALLLISKIENSQYSETSVINLNLRITDILQQFNDFIVARNLQVNYKEKDQVNLNMNPDLADFILSNLLGNAVKHNLDNGWINIVLDQSGLIIKNPGRDPGISTAQLFLRFKKAGHSTDSPGLGLAIVREIADLYNLRITYTYGEEIHTLQLLF